MTTTPQNTRISFHPDDLLDDLLLDQVEESNQATCTPV